VLVIFGFAVAGAFAPAMIKLVVLTLIKHVKAYAAWRESLEELFLGSMALSITAALNHYEASFSVRLGKAASYLSAICVASAFISIIGYCIFYFGRHEIFRAEHDDGSVLTWALAYILVAVSFAGLAVLQDRRMKDHLGEI